VEIRKAIITAAGKSQRTLPLQTLVDRDGASKTALRIIIEEILSAGIEEICVIICPGDREAYAAAAGDRGSRLTFARNSEFFRGVIRMLPFSKMNHTGTTLGAPSGLTVAIRARCPRSARNSSISRSLSFGIAILQDDIRYRA